MEEKTWAELDAEEAAEREKLRGVLEFELRDLWRHVPLTPDAIAQAAPTLTQSLAGGDGHEALRAVEHLLRARLTQRDAGALAAALGVHPSISEGDVLHRFTTYAELIGRDDASTARRAAVRAAAQVAELLIPRRFDRTAGQLNVLLLADGDDLAVRFVQIYPSSEASLLVSARSADLPTHRLLGNTDNPGPIAGESEAARKATWTAWELAGTLKESATVEIVWLGSTNPHMLVKSDPSFACSTTVLTQGNRISITIQRI
ncbi:hypothetical protein [Nocardioides sp.]|uniref:hypothetical protein n=1 Tax=Nocardioides sp. TaxID=35761 RepID=UPI002BE73A86|nr:hypothetical protein [Nocardioides sp.]HSX65933.1 hypothetical protein [Nocardioides sp.]